MELLRIYEAALVGIVLLEYFEDGVALGTEFVLLLGHGLALQAALDVVLDDVARLLTHLGPLAFELHLLQGGG